MAIRRRRRRRRRRQTPGCCELHDH